MIFLFVTTKIVVNIHILHQNTGFIMQKWSMYSISINLTNIANLIVDCRVP